MSKEWSFPGGKKKAITLSYDDGVLQDERLIEILRKYHIKGTFNINSGLLGKQGTYRDVNHSWVEPERVKEIYEGFEVAMHTCTHIKMAEVSDDILIQEVEEDRHVLEKLVGYPVVGLAYPCGSYNQHVMDILKEKGILYARTVEQTGNFDFPGNLLEWKGTCRHTDPDWLKYAEEFIKPETEGLFYLWGHSYEFDMYHNWERMEYFCKMVGEREDIWYATNREVAEWILRHNKTDL